jgi:hypothetical protein
MNNQQFITPDKEFIDYINDKRQERPNYTISNGIFTYMIDYLRINHNDKEHHFNYFWERSWGDKAIIYMYHCCKTYGDISDEICWKIWRGEINELNPSYKNVVETYKKL